MNGHSISLGAIVLWPRGYAMTLGQTFSGGSVRCCDGHETPQAAREHGIIRALEVAQARSAEDVAKWATNPPAETSAS